MNLIKGMMAVMPALEPIIKILVEKKYLVDIAHRVYYEPFTKDGVTNFIVYDMSMYKTEEEAKQHVEMQKKLNDLGKTLSK